MPTERELKFTIDTGALPGDAVLAEALAGSGMSLEPLGTERHADRYYDDPRASLGRAGLALRRRIGGGRILATLKTRGRVQGALHERGELELPMSDREWPAPIRDRVSAVTDVAGLKGRWELETERRRFHVASDDRVVAELSLDLVEGTRPTGGRTVRFAELEIEDRGGGADALDEIAARIAGVLPLVPSTETKLERTRRMLLTLEPGSTG